MISTFCFGQNQTTIKDNIIEITKNIQTKSYKGLNSQFCDSKDLKKIFVNSDTDDFEKIKKNWGYFIDKPENSIFDFLTSKLNKNQISALKASIIIYQNQKTKSKQFIIQTYYNVSGIVYELELYALEIDNIIYYRPKEPISKIKTQSFQEFLGKLKNENLENYTVIDLNNIKPSNSDKEKIQPYALLDEKPQFNQNESLGVFTKKLKAKAMVKILKDQDLRNELKGTQRVIVSMIVTSDKKFDDIYIKTNSDNLKEVIEDIMAEQIISNEGKKDGLSVNSQISFPLILKIN